MLRVKRRKKDKLTLFIRHIIIVFNYLRGCFDEKTGI